MRLEDDPDIAVWLDRRSGDAEDFDLDAGNQTKHAKHDVASTEIEAMLRHPLVFAARSSSRLTPNRVGSYWAPRTGNRRRAAHGNVSAQLGGTYRPGP
jgi:hypothetical protein